MTIVCAENDNMVPMKPRECTLEDSFYAQDSALTYSAVADASDRLKRILDTKYEKTNLGWEVEKCTNLNEQERHKLLNLLKKYEGLFDGQLGTWKDIEYDIELKEGAEIYHGKAYPIPKAYEAQSKTEVQRLCEIGVLRKVNRSQWGAPTFIIPKKDNTVRFISDFRELNKRIKRKPYPIPKIQDLLLKLEGFQYATSLDLNMGYYHI